MDSEKAKKAAELAEKELHEEEEQRQIGLIKKAIKQTLEAIKTKEEGRTKLNKEIKTLKQDIDNIRAGLILIKNHSIMWTDMIMSPHTQSGLMITFQSMIQSMRQ